MKVYRRPVKIEILNHGAYKLPDSIRQKSFKVYEEVCVLCYERWRHFAEWEPTIEFPEWVESQDNLVRLDNIHKLGVALSGLNNPKKEDDFLFASIFQADVKSLCKGLKFLHSKVYLRAWDLFFNKIARFGSYERVFLSVTQLYEEYIRFCVEVLQRKPILKSIQVEYPDFVPLLNAAIWCVKYNIDPAVYVRVMYEAFSSFDEKVRGTKSQIFFSCKHVGSTSQIRPPVRKFLELNEKVHPWKEIIQFLGLDEKVRIECEKGIPLGFKLADRHLNAGGTMKEITLIQDEFYWVGGVRYQARFHFDDNTAFSIFVSPKNFGEFRSRWNDENPQIPDYEMLKKYGRANLSKERYESIKKLYERMM